MPELQTPEDLARQFQVSPSTILLWVESRGLPCIRLSQRTIRFDPLAVQDWLQRQTNVDRGIDGGGR